jgi:hypothetical protein
VEPVLDWRLGDPGPFVVDSALAGPLFLHPGPAEVVRRQLQEPVPLPGMRPTEAGVSLLLDLMLETVAVPGTLDVFVTHDSVIAAVAGHLLQVIPDAAVWPRFLDGVFVWHREGTFGIAWQGTVQESSRAFALQMRETARSRDADSHVG